MFWLKGGVAKRERVNVRHVYVYVCHLGDRQRDVRPIMCARNVRKNGSVGGGGGWTQYKDTTDWTEKQIGEKFLMISSTYSGLYSIVSMKQKITEYWEWSFRGFNSAGVNSPSDA